MNYNELYEIGKMKITLPEERESNNYFSNAMELKSINFDPFTTYNLRSVKSRIPQYNFVMFYAPWCGYCQRLKDLWKQFAKEMKYKNVKIQSFNCEKNKDYLLLMNEEFYKSNKVKFVPSYPTLKFYKDGIPIKTFTNERTLPNLISFVRESL